MTSCEILVARAKFLVALATRKSQFLILIRNLSIQGEKLSAAVETVEPFLQKLCKVNEEKGLTLSKFTMAMKQDSCGSVYLTELLWHAVKKLPWALRSQRII